jgi:hypothetical protein
MASRRFRSDRESDPIAELARLIVQADIHEGYAPSNSRSREETVSDGRDEIPELPPAPQLAVDLNVDGRAPELTRGGPWHPLPAKRIPEQLEDGRAVTQIICPGILHVARKASF